MLGSIRGTSFERHVPSLVKEIEADCRSAQAGKKIDVEKTNLKLGRLEIALKANSDALRPANQKILQKLKNDVAKLSLQTKGSDAPTVTKSWVKPVAIATSVAAVAGLAFAAYRMDLLSGVISQPIPPKPDSVVLQPKCPLTELTYCPKEIPLAGASTPTFNQTHILISDHEDTAGIPGDSLNGVSSELKYQINFSENLKKVQRTLEPISSAFRSAAEFLSFNRRYLGQAVFVGFLAAIKLREKSPVATLFGAALGLGLGLSGNIGKVGKASPGSVQSKATL